METAFDFLRKIEEIAEKDSRYKIEAYSFVMAALNYTVAKLDKPRHVTAKELLEGIRVYSLDQFGPMAKTVFEHWGVKNTLDFGNIVFNMVNNKLLGKTEEDKLEDFKDVYSFDEVF